MTLTLRVNCSYTVTFIKRHILEISHLMETVIRIYSFTNTARPAMLDKRRIFNLENHIGDTKRVGLFFKKFSIFVVKRFCHALK